MLIDHDKAQVGEHEVVANELIGVLDDALPSTPSSSPIRCLPFRVPTICRDCSGVLQNPAIVAAMVVACFALSGAPSTVCLASNYSRFRYRDRVTGKVGQGSVRRRTARNRSALLRMGDHWAAGNPERRSGSTLFHAMEDRAARGGDGNAGVAAGDAAAPC